MYFRRSSFFSPLFIHNRQVFDFHCGTLFLLQEKFESELEYRDDEKLQHSLHILRLLLPFLKQLNNDQVMEKMMEAKQQGSPSIDDLLVILNLR